MSKWAPLVHGRTYEVDFRTNLIVVPDGFGSTDIEWAREFARASTRSAEALDAGPRWLLFKNDRFLVAGVTCYADAVSADKTRDKPNAPNDPGRRLYVFLGLVTTDLTADPPPMELAPFAPLYEYVRRRWDERPPADDVFHEPASEMAFPLSPVSDRPPLRLNSNPARLVVWPDSERGSLWTAASRHVGPVSLCLGMDRTKDAIDTELLNVTVAGSNERVEVPRHVPTSNPITPPPPIQDTVAPVHRGLGQWVWEFLNQEIHLFGSTEPARSPSQKRVQATPPTESAIPAGFRKKVKSVPDQTETRTEILPASAAPTEPPLRDAGYIPGQPKPTSEDTLP